MINYRLLIIVLIFCGLYSCKNTNPNPVDENIIVNAVEVELDKKLDSIHKLGHTNGLGVALVNEKGSIFESGYGYSDRKIRANYTANTIQPIASISKVILGLTLAKAIEDGHLTLEDDINKFLDFEVRNPQYPEIPVLVKHLASHTSSINDGDYYDQSYINLEPDASENPNIDQEELANFYPMEDAKCLEAFLKNGLTNLDVESLDYIYSGHSPGTAYDYSNIGAGLTALVIEKATGTSFKEYSKKNIIAPLGLKNTSWNLSDLDSRKASTLYSTLELRHPNYRLITFADGGLYTSPHDLGIILTELIRGYNGNGTLLNTASYVQYYKKQLEASNFSDPKTIDRINDNLNHGIFIEYNNEYIGHTGGDPGVNTVMFFEPENNLGFIIFLNTDINTQESYNSFLDIGKILSETNKNILKKKNSIE
ncbi:MAG: serine hydrolase domain-containing protein [Nonlabens sp.]|uniref:serine hydrolase domain-containing protein n=1 Tax=Nonlabens sp. TaxID=1888209 RepID=UPI003219E210